MNYHSIATKALFPAYFAWALVGLGRSAWVLVGNNGMAQFGTSFVSMYVLVVLGLVSLGGLFAWYTQRGKTWARWLFMSFCLIYAADALLGSFAGGPIYSQMPHPHSLFRGPVTLVVWLGLFGLAVLARPNRSFQPTVNLP